MAEFITRHEAIRQSPAYQRVLTQVTAIATLKNAERFEYSNPAHKDKWIFWKAEGKIVASAILGESAATLSVTRPVSGINDNSGEIDSNRIISDSIVYNDGEAWGLVHLGTLVEASEGEDSATWAMSLIFCGEVQ